jgi:hypothetical protein
LIPNINEKRRKALLREFCQTSTCANTKKAVDHSVFSFSPRIRLCVSRKKMSSGTFNFRCLLSTLLVLSFSSDRHLVNAFSSASRIDKTNVVPRTTGKPVPSTKVVDMGQDKIVNIFLPSSEEQQTKKKDDDGSVLQPSSFALARMVAHCPSLINGRNILELGCGLGLVSATACKHARPNHVAVSDRDYGVLSLAYATCTQLQKSKASVSRCTMDWSDQRTWPNQDYNLLLASDILYEASSIVSLVNVLKHYLTSDSVDFRKRALIVDPIEQVNRESFCYAAYRAGLEVETTAFPGMDKFVLLDIFSRD